MPKLHNTLQLLVALVCAVAIGWEREARARSAGLRTFPLVAVASCGFLQIVLGFAPDNDEARARVIYGLMTGIGFIGGGAILKGRGGVHGTATAASIWNTGAIGAAVAFDRYPLAISLTLVNVVVLRLIPPVKAFVRGKGRGRERNRDEE